MSVITDLIDENSSCNARIAELEARIVELESAAESLRISRDYHHEQEIEYRRRWAGIYAAPVSEAKAQGVTDEQAAFEAAVAAVNERGLSTSTDLARQIWDAARIDVADCPPSYRGGKE